jgi:hypothetical protein
MELFRKGHSGVDRKQFRLMETALRRPVVPKARDWSHKAHNIERDIVKYERHVARLRAQVAAQKNAERAGDLRARLEMAEKLLASKKNRQPETKSMKVLKVYRKPCSLSGEKVNISSLRSGNRCKLCGARLHNGVHPGDKVVEAPTDISSAGLDDAKDTAAMPKPSGLGAMEVTTACAAEGLSSIPSPAATPAVNDDDSCAGAPTGPVPSVAIDVVSPPPPVPPSNGPSNVVAPPPPQGGVAPVVVPPAPCAQGWSWELLLVVLGFEVVLLIWKFIKTSYQRIFPGPRVHKVRAVPKTSHALKGYVMPKCELLTYARAKGYRIVDYKIGRLKYAGERRLVKDRNVVETKSDMDVCTVVLDVTWLDFIKNMLIRAFWIIGTKILCRYVTKVTGMVFPWYVENLVSIGAGMMRHWFDYSAVHLPGRRHLTYVPHIVSCLITEYDRGTNREVVENTIRMKANRLATLPVPDKDAVSLMEGSVAIALEYIISQGFARRQLRSVLERTAAVE